MIHYTQELIPKQNSIWESLWQDEVAQNPQNHYEHQDSFRTREKQLKNYSWNQKKVSQWFLEEQQFLELSEKQNKNLEKIQHQNPLFVFTGQQPQVLTGPIFCIYKALTTVEQANKWEQKFKRAVVPVFWIAGDDDDALECGLLEFIEQWEENYQFFSQTRESSMMGTRKIKKELSLLFDFLSEKWSKDLVQKLKNRVSISSSYSLVDCFKQWMQIIVGETGILFLNGQSSHFQELAKKSIYKVIEKSDEFHTHFESESQSILKKVGKTQVPIEKKIHAFECIDGFRYRVQKPLFDASKKYTHDALSRIFLIAEVFPVIAHVLGPGEIGYFLQLRQVLQKWSGGMPLIVPRMTAVILPYQLQKISIAFSFSTSDLLLKPLSKIKHEWIEKLWDKKGFQTEKPFQKELQISLKNLQKQMKISEYTYCAEQEKLLKKINFQIKKWTVNLKKNLFREHQLEYQEFMQGYQWLRFSVFQDRHLNVFSLANQWGSLSEITNLLNQLKPLERQQQIIFWEYQ